MQVTVQDLRIIGLMATIENLIRFKGSAMQLPCVPGPWIVVLCTNGSLGRPEELLHDFLQR